MTQRPRGRKPPPPPVVPASPEEAALLAMVAADPVLFCRVFLGFEPWDMQAKIMQAVAEHDRVAVASGHKIGKSILAAAIAIWFCVTRRDGRVILTAAIGRQVERVLWREVTRLHKQAKRRVENGVVIHTPIGGRLALAPDKGLRFDDGREIFGFATDQAENMAGYSGENLLFIIDEASGVEEKIFQAIEGNRAGGAKTLMLSNPTRPSGTFFDAFHSKRSFYKQFQISSETTPNVLSGRRLVPGLATAEYIAEKREEWGPDYKSNPLYKVRILGEFAAQSPNALVSLADLMQGIASYDVDDITDAEAPLRAGLDVAREGDDENVLTPRRGRRLPRLPLLLGRGDGHEIADRAVRAINDWMTPKERMNPGSVTIFVDAIGVGWSPVDALRRHPARGFKLVPVVSSMKSDVMGENGIPIYLNLRAEMWFAMSAWSKFCILPDGDGKFQEELIDVRYQTTEKLQMKIERKEDIKKRLGRSPDRADSLALTFAPDTSFRLDARKSSRDSVLASL